MVDGRARALLLGLLLGLGACAGASYRDSPQYSAGYAAGCASAPSASRVIPSRIERDEALYKADKAYRAGWNAGYQACGPAPQDDLGGRGGF